MNFLGINFKQNCMKSVVYAAILSSVPLLITQVSWQAY